MTQTRRKKSFYAEIIYQHKRRGTYRAGVKERFIYLATHLLSGQLKLYRQIADPKWTCRAHGKIESCVIR
jgi:hypothetical protein